jgi:hypothetical protein
LGHEDKLAGPEGGSLTEVCAETIACASAIGCENCSADFGGSDRICTVDFRERAAPNRTTPSAVITTANVITKRRIPTRDIVKTSVRL